MTVLEVGANIGYYALIEAGLVGPEGRIIAFEPSPANMVQLRSNVIMNDLQERFEIHQMGIGQTSGKMKFHLMNKGNMSSFYARATGSGIETLDYIDVNVISLDEFFADKYVKIDYLRMDVEGFEYEIILGMSKLLDSEYSPEGFFIEVHSQLLNENEHSCKSFLKLLQSFGYCVKTARYRGSNDIVVHSNKELNEHDLCEEGYWEAFFRRNKTQ